MQNYTFSEYLKKRDPQQYDEIFGALKNIFGGSKKEQPPIHRSGMDKSAEKFFGQAETRAKTADMIQKMIKNLEILSGQNPQFKQQLKAGISALQAIGNPQPQAAQKPAAQAAAPASARPAGVPRANVDLSAQVASTGVPKGMGSVMTTPTSASGKVAQRVSAR